MFASMFAMILSFSLVRPLIFIIRSSSVLCLDGLWGWFSIIVWILSLISVSARRFPFSSSLKESLNLSALGVLTDVMELANDFAVL